MTLIKYNIPFNSHIIWSFHKLCVGVFWITLIVPVKSTLTIISPGKVSCSVCGLKPDTSLVGANRLGLGAKIAAVTTALCTGNKHTKKEEMNYNNSDHQHMEHLDLNRIFLYLFYSNKFFMFHFPIFSIFPVFILNFTHADYWLW